MKVKGRKLAGQAQRGAYYKAALALATGLLWGEIRKLAWADINLDDQPSTITIRRSWCGDPKSEHSAATLRISDDAASILRQWKAEQGGACSQAPRESSGPAPKRKDVIAISNAAEEARITCKVTPHIFRHKFAT